MKKIGIIGAGIGGLAASIRLAVKGYEVEVFEANAYPGGKLSEIRLGDYRFDAGPSLFTLPFLVDELFVLAGRNPEEYFRYIKLPYTCYYYYPDGTVLHASSNIREFALEAGEKTKENPDHILAALNHSSFLYSTLSDLFMYRSLHQLKTFFNRSAFKAYGRIPQLDFFRSMNKANEARFTDSRMVQLFNRYATYNGSDPYQTPATLNIIPHLEFNIGAYLPEGGMYAITNALFGLSKELGVKFHFNTPVRKIRAGHGRIKGVVTDRGEQDFSSVVSNMDVVNTYRKLLPDIKPPEKLLSQPKSSSALIFYWGIRKSFNQLYLHNIFFSGNYRDEFEFIFKKKIIPSDPTVYINITSKYINTDAPEGKENWFTMINVPNNTGQDWDQLIFEARNNILVKLSSMLGEDIGVLIEEEDILDPRTIESRTSSSQGALYGNSSNNLYAAFLRHANFSKRIKGLFFCGGSVHPGGGIPLSLSSAKIVAGLFD